MMKPIIFCGDDDEPIRFTCSVELSDEAFPGLLRQALEGLPNKGGVAECFDLSRLETRVLDIFQGNCAIAIEETINHQFVQAIVLGMQEDLDERGLLKTTRTTEVLEIFKTSYSKRLQKRFAKGQGNKKKTLGAFILELATEVQKAGINENDLLRMNATEFTSAIGMDYHYYSKRRMNYNGITHPQMLARVVEALSRLPQ